jgi:ferrous iron transport protein B
MSIAPATRSFTVALIGNPNTGKSTLFTALCGVRQRVGNYPGVTVEKKVGRLTHGSHHYRLIDLPGTYSLSPRSPDEMVAVDVLLGRRDGEAMPDAVICIVDASNLERNLYVVSQILELGRPTLVALNMVDVAESRGLKIDAVRLQERLGVPVVPIQAHRRAGIEDLRRALAQVVKVAVKPPASPFPEAFQREVAALEQWLNGRQSEQRPCDSERSEESPAAPRAAAPAKTLRSAQGDSTAWPRYLVERLILDVGGYLESSGTADAALGEQVSAARDRLKQVGLAVPAVEAMSRYAWIGRVVEGVVTRPTTRPVTATDRVDGVLTHRFWGTAILALLMAGMFCSIFLLADVPMGWIESGIDATRDWVKGLMDEGPMQSLIVDGVIAGVGGVVVFLPQILLLFLFIALMESTGYMARAAYLMDKLMARVGLSGKSFLPLLSSFACAVPGIMAARVIENRRDRLTTILVAPLMSCSARLPVYVLLVGAFIPTGTLLGPVLPGLVFFSMYALGILVAVVMALLLKRTLLKGQTPPFVMELPSYKLPSIGMVLHRMAERGWAFVRRAGTLILATTIIIWALGYYPRDKEKIEGPHEERVTAIKEQLKALPDDAPERAALEDEQADIKHQIEGDHLRNSFLGRAGQYVEPAVRPLGWDWRIGCAAIASFPAREVVVGTLGVIYNLGGELEDTEEDQSLLRRKIQEATWDGTDQKVYNVPVALSIMVFFALCAQCVSTLVIIRRETNSWRWPAFTFVYMTALAYLGALVTYQVGMRL